MLCVWWDQEGVIYYEYLKSGETVNADRYRQQLIDLNRTLLKKRSQYKKRQHKLILHHDNDPAHKAKRFARRWKTKLESTNPYGLLIRLGTVGLPFVFIDGSRA